MKLLKELTIVIPNKPGKLAAVLNAVARAKINILALKASAGYDLNMVRIIASDTNQCKKILEKLGYWAAKATVLGFTLPDRPGELAKVTSAFAKKHVNINYLYATAADGGSHSLLIFHLSDIEAGKRALQAAGID
ncbi:MAG: ACT domain-containing protein [Verrucomicrobia bacterium]|nr:ACT domain-containing protein [Verrucomicrobiota bacterium]